MKHNFKSDGAILSLQRRCYCVCRWVSISWHRRWSNCKQTERWLQDAKTETYWPEAVSRMSFLQCKEHFICERDDFRRIDKHVKFIKNCGLWHLLIRCRNVTLPIYLLCSFLILMCLKTILQKTMHRVSI